jgi:hypothetical protein
MNYFTIRNTVILALVQVGVVVAGVLAAGAAYKWYATFNLKPPSLTALLADYGLLALVLPLAWVALALQALRRGEDWDDRKLLAIWSGILLLLLLLLGVGYVAVRPLLRLIGGLG